MPIVQVKNFPFRLEKPKTFAFSVQKSIFWAKSVKRPLGSKRSNNLPSLLQDPFSFWTWVFVAAGYQLRCRVGCNKRDLPPSFAIMVTLLQKFFFKEFKKNYFHRPVSVVEPYNFFLVPLKFIVSDTHTVYEEQHLLFWRVASVMDSNWVLTRQIV